jgi:hypothetical protein
MDVTTLTDAELRDLINQAGAELQRRQPATLLRVAVTFGSYNARRYSRPWIARVTAWPIGGKPAVEWGRYLGDDSGGECEITARAGDLVRYGQKDTRGGKTDSNWATVAPDGTLIDCTEAQARAAHKP